MRREKRFEISECSQRRKTSLTKKNITLPLLQEKFAQPLISNDHFISYLLEYFLKKFKKFLKIVKVKKLFEIRNFFLQKSGGGL